MRVRSHHRLQLVDLPIYKLATITSNLNLFYRAFLPQSLTYSSPGFTNSILRLNLLPNSYFLYHRPYRPSPPPNWLEAIKLKLK